MSGSAQIGTLLEREAATLLRPAARAMSHVDLRSAALHWTSPRCKLAPTAESSAAPSEAGSHPARAQRSTLLDSPQGCRTAVDVGPRRRRWETRRERKTARGGGEGSKRREERPATETPL